MIVSLKWLRDYVDIPLSVDELAERLTMTGLEVEGVHQRGEAIQSVITARVEEIARHPRADHLHLCKVFDGRKTIQVVCGAPNLEQGAVVPLVLAGGELPNGMVLREAKIRGELSQGMLCSQKELELGEDASGIWLLPPETSVGVPLCNALGINDVILEIGITPNRSDCLCTLGIAREIAAICGTSLTIPTIEFEEKGPAIESLSSVVIEDPVGCPRYAARIVQNVRIGSSPVWLKEKLEAVGLRSINNIVDVTNFILMEMGQPLHAFDFDRLREHRIVVRPARQGERFSTLDEVERSLFDDTVMICDGQGPVAIGGIMGGLNSEISSETTNVLIESAYFQPESIRRSSKKLGLRTEASYRFERGVDPGGTLCALDRAAQLVQQLAGGEIAKGRIDVYPTPVELPTLTLRVDRTNQFLGTEIEVSEMEQVLASIEMQVHRVDDNHLRVIPPSFRPDIVREVDLTEEIARLIGYNRIPITYPQAGTYSMPDNDHRRKRENVKQKLQAMGFSELLTYSFISSLSLQKLRLPPDDPRLSPVSIRNPLSEEQSVMRTTLIPGLIQTMGYNFDHQNENLRLFELSKIFLPREGEPLPEERFYIAGAMTGKRLPHLLYGDKEEVDYADVKGAVESLLDLLHVEGTEFLADKLPPYVDPLYSASISCKGESIGVIGRLHPDVQENFDLKKSVMLFELDFDRLYNFKQAHPAFEPLPRFPAVIRDMALVVNENIPVRGPLDFVLKEKETFLVKAEIFDLYQDTKLGKGKKSVGYRLTYRSDERSLTDEEVNNIHGRLMKKVLDTFQADLR